MKICVSCKKEMRCTKNGRTAVWNRTHVYRGDEYTCPGCQAKFLVCNAEPYHDESALRMATDEPIDMTGSQEKPDCYKCIYRRPLPGNAHSQCLSPKAVAIGQPHGVKSGWFMWPFNFDPVWLLSCDGFEAVKGVGDETQP